MHKRLLLTCPVTMCTTAIPPSDMPRYILLGSGLSVAMAVIPRGHGEAIILSGSEVWRFQKRRCCPVDAIRSIDLSRKKFKCPHGADGRGLGLGEGLRVFPRNCHAGSIQLPPQSIAAPRVCIVQSALPPYSPCNHNKREP